MKKIKIKKSFIWVHQPYLLAWISAQIVPVLCWGRTAVFTEAQMGHANASQPQTCRPLLTQPSVLSVCVCVLTVCDPCVLSELEVQPQFCPVCGAWCPHLPETRRPASASAGLLSPISCALMVPDVWCLCVCDCRWSVISTGRAVEQRHTAWFKCPCWIRWS